MVARRRCGGGAGGGGWGHGLSVFPGKTAPVPDLIGETQARAEEMLQEAELEGEAIGRKYTGEFTPGEVQDQDPDPGESIPLGSTVEFIIEAQPAEVPPVIGEEFGRAVMTLLRAEFQVDEPTLVRNENMVGKVIDQAPKPGTKVEEGSVVHLSVGRSPLVVHPSWKEMLNPEVLEKMESSLNRSRLRIMDKIE